MQHCGVHRSYCPPDYVSSQNGVFLCIYVATSTGTESLFSYFYSIELNWLGTVSWAVVGSIPVPKLSLLMASQFTCKVHPCSVKSLVWFKCLLPAKVQCGALGMGRSSE